MPEYWIRTRFGEAPERVFSRVGFSGSHSRTIELVQSGAYEVGAVNFQVWKSEVEAGNVDAAKVSIIWTTPPYPDYQWTVRGDVDDRFGAGFKEKVRAALLAMNDPDLLETFPRSRFIPASNEDFQPILDTAKEIGLVD
jgi:phosphonate transport system substrate-binding protein